MAQSNANATSGGNDWLMGPSDDERETSPAGPFAQGAPHYKGKGFNGIMPLVKESKIPARDGLHGRKPPQTGAHWFASAKTLAQYGHHNIAWRLPVGVLGIDVDHGYGKKVGADTLAALEAELGALPRTWSSTSRGQDSPSRIYFFKVPASAGELTPGAGKDIDTIQHHLRYAAVWPSVHPSTGETYRWYDKGGIPATEPPDPEDFAELPAAWLEHLSKPQIEHTDGAGLDVQEFMDLCRYETDPELARHVLDIFNDTPGSRHDTMLRALGWSARQAAEGKVKASVIFEILEDAWEKATDGEGRTQEFNDLLETAVREAPEPYDPDDPDGPKFAPGTPVEIQIKAKEILQNREALRQANWWEAKQRSEERTSISDLLDEILNGDEEDVPTIGKIVEHDKSWGLFYPETVNGMYGDSSVGKSVIIAELQARELADGGTVVHWEFDNNSDKAILRRLLHAGAKPQDIGARFHILTDVTDRDALPPAVFKAVSLVTLDAVNPAVTAFGLETNQTNGVDKVLHECMKPFVKNGACGIFVDHVGHEHKERQAGSIRKSQAVQGALYEVTRLVELKPGRTGRTAMVLRKDNRGALGSEGRTVAVAEMTSGAVVDGAPGKVDMLFVLPDPFNSESPDDYLISGGPDPKVQALIDLFGKHDAPRAGRPAIAAHLKALKVELKGDTKVIAEAVRLYKNGAV